MKTLSQVKEAAGRKRAERRKERQRVARRYGQLAQDWRDLHRVTVVDEERAEQMRLGVLNEHLFPIGIACDHCNFELVSTPGFGIVSYPRRRRVGCGACGSVEFQEETDQED